MLTIERIGRGFLPLAAAGLGGLLVFALVRTPDKGQGLAGPSAEALPESGVTNPVTAVLLNFRAFDTLLEIAVLLLTLVGVWALGLRIPGAETLRASSIFASLLRLSAPVLTVIAGYLLWIGAKAPGGAFQAGAVLAGVGVLLHVAGLLKLRPSVLRWAAVAGLLVFVAVGLAMLAQNGALLDYPPASAGGWILLIETAATISIAAILTALFLGAEPVRTGRDS